MSGRLIERLNAGQTPTLLSAAKANELVDALNALQNISINYGESFSASYGSNGIILTIPDNSGSQINADEIKLNVCINGVNTEKIFYVKK